VNIVIGFAVGVLAFLVIQVLRDLRKMGKETGTALKILRSDLANVAGKQVGLESEYHEVHKILQSIRDLNQAELQDRKEILQHQNFTAANRVLQTRAHMAQLEEAARKELEGLNG
jgi:uncharacterized protein YoxC